MTETITSQMPVDISDALPTLTPGADWKWSFYYLDDNALPVDTTGYTVKMDIREYGPNGALIKTLTTTSGITNTPVNGQFDVAFLAADTTNIMVDVVVFDIFVTDNTGGVEPWYCGTIPVNPRVTK